MVLLLVLITALVKHVYADHDQIGWTGQYLKFSSDNCNNVQAAFDRKHIPDWAQIYKSRYNSLGEQMGDGIYPAYFAADRVFSRLDLRAFANAVGNSNINIRHPPRCHGIRFSSRIGYTYDSTLQDDPRIFTSYFCYKPNAGWSAVAFQSGRRVSGSWQEDGRLCHRFRAVNVEAVVIYTFSGLLSGAYDFSVQHDVQLHPAAISSYYAEQNSARERFFRAVGGYFEIDESIHTDALDLSVDVNGLVDSATAGQVSVSAKCKNSELHNSELLIDDDSWGSMVADGCGTKLRPDTVRVLTSENSAVAICKKPDGTCVQPFKGTVSFFEAHEYCRSRGWGLNTEPDFGDACCDSLSAGTDWGFDWSYAWINDPNPLSEWKIRYSSAWLNDATAPVSPDQDQDELNVAVVNSDGDQFAAELFVGEPLEMFITFERRCAVLEVAFEFIPASTNQEKVVDVREWRIYRQPGFYIFFWPLPVSVSRQWLDNLRLSGDITSDDLGDSDNYASTFWAYSDINFIADEFQTPNWGFPEMTATPLHYCILIRAALKVVSDRQCQFKVAVASGKVWLEINGNFLIDADGNSLNSTNDTSSIIQVVEAASSFHLRANVFYSIDVRHIHYGGSFGTEHSQLSLLWTCSDPQGRPLGTEIVPRRNLYSQGSDITIISSRDHINVDPDVSPYSTFKVSLSRAPMLGSSQVTCSVPEGSLLSISPNFATFNSRDWSTWTTFTVVGKVGWGKDTDLPDTAITCSSENGEEIYIYYTHNFKPATSWFLSAAGLFSSVVWSESGPSWLTKTSQIQTRSQFQSIHSYSDSETFSCIIQTMHDLVDYSADSDSLSPVVGFAINFGTVVFAVYPSATSIRARPYMLSSSRATPREERLKIIVTDGTIQIEAADGTKCEIDFVGGRFMDVTCDIPGYMPVTDPGPVVTRDLLFTYPRTALSLPISTRIPTWPGDAIPSVFPPHRPPRLGQQYLVNLGWVDASEELNWYNEVTDPQYDHSARGVWSRIQRGGKCPLLDGLYSSLLMRFGMMGTSGRAQSKYTVVDGPTSITSLVSNCALDMYFSKLLSCLSGNYRFNEDNARASMRNILFHTTNFWIDINDRLPGSLVNSFENGKPDHFCNKDGHLVGRPPVCACIGNGRYPDCEETVTCEAPNQDQLDTMRNAGVFSQDTEDTEGSGLTYCQNEKSLVIDSENGNAMYFNAGYGTFWTSLQSQTGLSLGTNPCAAPYCVTGVSWEVPQGDRTWWGLTECGTTVTSADNGKHWQTTDNIYDATRCDLDAYCAEEIEENEQSTIVGDQTFTWTDTEVCLTDQSTGKKIKYCVQWHCNCHDLWSNLI